MVKVYDKRVKEHLLFLNIFHIISWNCVFGFVGLKVEHFLLLLICNFLTCFLSKKAANVLTH